MTLFDLITLYAARSAAHTYILGFISSGNLYRVTLTFTELTAYIRQSRTSSSKGSVLQARIRVNAKQAAELVESGKAILMGSAKMLETDDKWNRGERFERIITETLTGKTWQKDSVPFWKAGDIELNGEQIQVKLSEAELTNEKTIRNALAAA